jgi:allophanate hydrolase
LARAPDAPVTPSFGPCFRFGVPPSSDLEFFRDEEASTLFRAAIGILEEAGGARVEMSFAPFRDAGRLLYEGPWVAERLHATQALLSESPDEVLPVTREIIERGRSYSALDVYRAQYALAALRRAAEGELRQVDVLLLPTTGTIYETSAIAAEPKRLNANLGLYTSFVNLLDLAAIALPAGFGKSGLPFGISLIAPAHRDSALLDLGRRFQQVAGLPLGASSV